MLGVGVLRAFSMVAWAVLAAVMSPAVARSLAGNALQGDADKTLKFGMALINICFAILGFAFPSTVRAMADNELSFRSALYLGSGLVACGFLLTSLKNGRG